MSQQSAVGSVTLKRLRNGDSLQLVINRTGRLYQIIPSGGGTPTPDYTDATNQPTLTPVIHSLRGNSVDVKSVTWKIDGVTISSADKNFAITDAGILKIVGNKFTLSADAYTHTLQCIMVVSINGSDVTDTISQTVDFEVRESNGSSYWGQIESEGLVLSCDLGSTTITPHLYKGYTELDYAKNEYYCKWYRVIGGTSNDTEVSSSQSGDVYYSGKQLVVKRNGVDGSANFICRFYTDSTMLHEVEAVGVTIRDNSDSYHIVITGDTDVAVDGVAVLTAQVYNINTGEVVDAVNFSADVKEAEGLHDITSGWSLVPNPVSGHTGYPSATFTMPEVNMKYNDKECEVVVTIEATL